MKEVCNHKRKYINCSQFSLTQYYNKYIRIGIRTSRVKRVCSLQMKDISTGFQRGIGI